MEKTFATLSRTFRALAALERTGVIVSVKFGQSPSVEITPEAHRALFPDAAVLHGSKATIYRSSICGMDVTAREVAIG
mgnify:FL=1